AVDRDAVAERYDFTRCGRHPCAWNQDADEVQGVGSRHDRGFGGVVAAADGAEGFDGFGERELLADEAGDEAAAADLAARLEGAKGAEEDAPRWHARLAGEELA